MAAGNGEPMEPSARGPFSIEDRLARLAAAPPKPATGRIRSVDEARGALKIPTSSEPDVLKAWGTPPDFQLAVYPVSDPDAPDLVAEFAILRVIVRDGEDLVAREPGRRLRLAEKSNALWIVYGSIVVAADTNLVIESLAVGPAFTGQLSRKNDEIALGITGKLLRLISPPRILTTCVERLATEARWLEETARQQPAPAMPGAQRDTLDRLEQARPRRSHVTDQQLAELAKRYITLCFRGTPHPRAQLAKEFGITTTQARDRIHQARQRGYLTKGTQGRAAADPGPLLTALGWQPPQDARQNQP